MKSAPAIATLLALLGAVLGDWVYDALYFHRDEPIHIAGALGLNLIAAAAILAALAWWLGEHAFRRVTFATALAGAGIVAWMAMRSGLPGFPLVPKVVRALLLVLLFAAAYRIAGRVSVQTVTGVPRALAAAAVAFALSPFAMSSMLAPVVPWPPVAASIAPTGPAPARNVVFLLLDELGDDAARPIAAALQADGLNVAFRSLVATGDDTINVIPAMFTRQNFAQAKPCGPAALCSGTSMIDFRKVQASRPDVDVISMYHPYCRIAGLRSCHEVLVPKSYRNAYISLANHYLARAGFPLPNADLELAVSAGLKGRFVQQQREALHTAAFWDKGGVLFAHLPLPHPPGHGGVHSLDADYQANLQLAGELARDVARRAIDKFGSDVLLVVASDHGLRRRIWCADSAFNPYRGLGCEVRDTFLSTRVPLLLARKAVEVPPPGIDTNRDIFDMMSTHRRQ